MKNNLFKSLTQKFTMMLDSILSNNNTEINNPPPPRVSSLFLGKTPTECNEQIKLMIKNHKGQAKNINFYLTVYNIALYSFVVAPFNERSRAETKKMLHSIKTGKDEEAEKQYLETTISETVKSSVQIKNKI